MHWHTTTVHTLYRVYKVNKVHTLYQTRTGQRPDVGPARFGCQPAPRSGIHDAGGQKWGMVVFVSVCACPCVFVCVFVCVCVCVCVCV